jgi:acyl-CoA synthetase (AMP-forming)/AMP-acid ligase II
MAGSAMPEELLNRVMKSFPISRLYTNWGMTELSSIATMTTAKDSVLKKMRTAGRLLPNLVGKIVRPDSGEVLPWGAKGEIVISGWAVMREYYGNEEQTRATIKQHEEDLQHAHLAGESRRWMHTGDEGYLDADGYFVITGRIKDLIIRGGENISPVEIESVLYDHPAVKQAVVFGVANARYGEEVAEMLEMEGDTKPSNTELKDWVRKSLAKYKAPVHIWWLGDEQLRLPKEWPKTANGKLRKIDMKKIGEGEMRIAPRGSFFANVW